MIERPTWAPALQWIIWFVLMSLTMGWLARTRQRPRPPDQANLMVHPRSTLVIGVTATGIFLVVAILSALFPGDTGSPLITLGFVAFAGLGVPIICDYFFARHAINSDGIDYGRMFGGRGVLRWADVRRVRYSTLAKWFRLESADGDVVRVSAMLLGLPEFARAVLTHVVPANIDAQARPILEAAAEGRLPPIWG
jgi:hypothetical protein